MVDEGVIRFACEHTERRLEPRRYGELACKLVAWREIMAKMQLVGQDPGRYGGAGYGNVSARVGPQGTVRGARAMLITGTQTGGSPHIGLSDMCLVDRYDYQRNWVRSEGQIKPSSETMTHGAIYDLSPAIRFVLHAHSPTIWQRAAALRLPTTDPSIGYGTPEMAQAVLRLYGGSALEATRILVMGGHEDGVIVFGYSAEQAGETLIRYLARAYESDCRVTQLSGL